MPANPHPPGSRPRRRPRPPLGLLGTVALIVAVESALMARDDDFTTLVASNWRTEGRAPARFASRNEILCFGDSMVKFGIQPRVLQPRLGMKAYNFALYCGAAPSSYFLLRRSFESGARPAAVVVDFQPELLAADTMQSIGRVYPEMLTWGETLDLCANARDFDRFAEFALAKLLPSARKRHEIRASVLAATRGQSLSSSVKERLFASRQNWSIHKGAEVLSKNPHYRGEIPDSDAYPAMFWTPWRVDGLNDLYVARFLELASSKRVPVFWVIPPNTAVVDERREKVGYNAQYDAYVRAYLDRFPNLTVIDGRRANYPHQVFNDPVHLDRQGATACSIGVAEVLRSRLVEHRAGPRWVPLPDHRAEMDAYALEDYVESGLALKAEENKARR